MLASDGLCSSAGASQADEEALSRLKCWGRLIDICKVDRRGKCNRSVWWSKVELKEEFGCNKVQLKSGESKSKSCKVGG